MLLRSTCRLATARQRLAGLKSINPAPDFGPALSVAGYGTEITNFSTALDNYNEKLSTVDELLNKLQADENALRVSSPRLSVDYLNARCSRSCR
jgi:hypothetical protein